MHLTRMQGWMTGMNVVLLGKDDLSLILNTANTTVCDGQSISLECG